jgi:hypothetical protein
MATIKIVMPDFRGRSGGRYVNHFTLATRNTHRESHIGHTPLLFLLAPHFFPGDTFTRGNRNIQMVKGDQLSHRRPNSDMGICEVKARGEGAVSPTPVTQPRGPLPGSRGVFIHSQSAADTLTPCPATISSSVTSRASLTCSVRRRMCRRSCANMPSLTRGAKAAIAERQKFGALLKMLRADLI